jgi:hypothetical protein
MLDHTYFCYPNEESIGGPTMLAHLHASMIRKNVLAVGELLQRVTTTSRPVALWPLTERFNSQGERMHPNGFLVFALPFEDEVRTIDDQRKGVASESNDDSEFSSTKLVDAAMALIEKQTVPNLEIGENFENARVSELWSYLEHVALGEPMSEQGDYDTIVDNEAILECVHQDLAAFRDCLPDDVPPVKPIRKRKIEADDSGVDWQQVYYDGTLSKCKVPELKKKLRSLGESIVGNKSSLIERLEPHLKTLYENMHIKEE